MPECSYCGCLMRQTVYGNSGISGGGGNRYKCPNTPHPKCKVCGKTMVREITTFNHSKGAYNRGEYKCIYCKGDNPK